MQFNSIDFDWFELLSKKLILFDSFINFFLLRKFLLVLRAYITWNFNIKNVLFILGHLVIILISFLVFSFQFIFLFLIHRSIFYVPKPDDRQPFINRDFAINFHCFWECLQMNSAMKKTFWKPLWWSVHHGQKKSL